MPKVNGKEAHMQDASILNVTNQISDGEVFADDRNLDKSVDKRNCLCYILVVV